MCKNALKILTHISRISLSVFSMLNAKTQNFLLVTNCCSGFCGAHSDIEFVFIVDEASEFHLNVNGGCQEEERRGSSNNTNNNARVCTSVPK
jgi:hypothetical protein